MDLINSPLKTLDISQVFLSKYLIVNCRIYTPSFTHCQHLQFERFQRFESIRHCDDTTSRRTDF